jgi:hypothetical protein
MQWSAMKCNEEESADVVSSRYRELLVPPFR